MNRNILFFTIILLIVSSIFIGCTSSTISQQNMTVLKVGANPTPGGQILKFAKPLLAEEGIDLQVIEFTDYVRPNLALSEGEIDANFFQHIPYMDSFSKEHNLELVSAGKVLIAPMGLYSKKIQSPNDLQTGDIITLPNDPTNEGRALILFEKTGLITLKDGVGLKATVKDIIENPLELEFKPMDAAQLPRTLDDAAAAFINTTYALEANLVPTKDAILLEDKDSPYVNIITVTPKNLEDERIKKLVEIMQSEEIRKYIEDEFQGAIVPAF